MNFDWDSGKQFAVIAPWLPDQDKWMGLQSHQSELEQAYRRGFKPEQFLDVTAGHAPRYFRTAHGGGVVDIGCEAHRWSRLVALGPAISAYNPSGFRSIGTTGMTMLVPAIRAIHRIGEVKVPLAPSPLIALEPESAESLEVLLRCTKPKDGEAVADAFSKVMAEFGCAISVLNLNEPEGNSVPKCSLLKPLTINRVRCESGDHPFQTFVAFVVYAGIVVHLSFPSLWVLDICGPFKRFPEAAMRAAEWNPRARPKRTADDW